MNPLLKRLQPYPFEKLANLKAGVTPADPGQNHIALSIGEPKHPAPEFVLQSLIRNLNRVENYPSTKGLPELREAIASWLCQRFSLASVNPDTQVLPVNGTREALFAAVQALFDPARGKPIVASPNPFYQIYEGAALLAGAEPAFIPCHESSDYQPDLDSVSEEQWQRTQILFICSPGNPTGAVLSMDRLQQLLALADRYDFTIFSDECYSELYPGDQPPPGLLEACEQAGRTDYHRCLVFHSLSKRSNLPGLRSGFVAGQAELIAQFLLYRTYHGCAMPVHHQIASAEAWRDELHVRQNRQLYQQKFDHAIATLDPVLKAYQPDGGFYIWAKTPGDDQSFARELFRHSNITVLPGSFLARESAGSNPGSGYIRMALVSTLEECREACTRINRFISTLN